MQEQKLGPTPRLEKPFGRAREDHSRLPLHEAPLCSFSDRQSVERRWLPSRLRRRTGSVANAALSDLPAAVTRCLETVLPGVTFVLEIAGLGHG